jgi:peptidoglycan hydrolase CwlO-like protein
MNSFLKKISGTLLIIAAIGGLIISVIGLYGVWRYKTPAENAIRGSVEVFNDTLAITYNGLTISKSALETSISSVESLETTIEATGDAIQSTQPMFDSIDKLLSYSLPKAIDATKQSLKTAQESAKVIDSVLKLLTFFKKDAYNPEVPFDKALGDISESLEDIPGAATDMGDSLQESTSNLETIVSELDNMSDSLSEIQESIQEFIKVIDQYIELIDTWQVKLDKLNTNLTAIINVLAVAFSLFLLWLALAQLGLILQGWELIKGDIEPPIQSEEEKSSSKPEGD